MADIKSSDSKYQPLWIWIKENGAKKYYADI